MKYMLCLYFLLFLCNTIFSLIRLNLSTQLDDSMSMTASAKASQNRKIRMKLNKLKISRSKSIHIKKIHEPNKYIDEQPKHDIDFNLFEPTEKDGTFHS